MMLKLLGNLANLFELSVVIGILILAFLFQLLFHELPCPLCLLQRAGFLCIAFGFLLNLRYGPRPSHYAIVLVSSLYTSFIALRQIAFHVIPGTGSYGDPVLSLHLYTWTYIITMVILTVTSIILGFDEQYQARIISNTYLRIITNILFTLVCLTLIINIVSVILECGLAGCPENPVAYQLI